MRKRMQFLIWICCLTLICGCSKKTDNTIEEVKETVADNTPAITIVEDSESENEEATVSDDENDTIQLSESFEKFAGEYYFSSGVGGWGTCITLDENGRFNGSYSDSDMGDIGDGYPDGTLYLSVFEGSFTELTRVDDYTFTAKLGDLNITTKTGTEVIIEDVRNIYTEPYGLENPGVFEFYLPGKKVSELSEEFLSWTNLRYCSVYPSRLYAKSFFNVNAGDGFESPEREKYTDEQEESLKVEPYEIAGKYDGDNGTIMSISIYSDIEDLSEIGNITFFEDENSPYQPEAKLGVGDNGFVGTPEWENPYTLVVTDNTNGMIELMVYDEYNFPVCVYTMIEHYEP